MTNDEKLDKLLTVVAEVHSWQQAHTVAHAAMNRDLGELRDELYGTGSMKLRQHALEQAVASIQAAGLRPPWWHTLFLGVCEKVISGAIIAFIMWLMFVYRTIPLP